MAAVPESTERDRDSGKPEGRVERLIGSLASGLGDGIGRLAESGLLFTIFLVLWVLFAAALLVAPDRLAAAWESLTGLPLVLQAVVWLLFLPVTAGLWIWQTDWPEVVRLAAIAALAGWNLLVFPKPWAAKGGDR